MKCSSEKSLLGKQDTLALSLAIPMCHKEKWDPYVTWIYIMWEQGERMKWNCRNHSNLVYFSYKTKTSVINFNISLRFTFILYNQGKESQKLFSIKTIDYILPRRITAMYHIQKGFTICIATMKGHLSASSNQKHSCWILHSTMHTKPP